MPNQSHHIGIFFDCSICFSNIWWLCCVLRWKLVTSSIVSEMWNWRKFDSFLRAHRKRGQFYTPFCHRTSRSISLFKFRFTAAIFSSCLNQEYRIKNDENIKMSHSPLCRRTPVVSQFWRYSCIICLSPSHKFPLFHKHAGDFSFAGKFSLPNLELHATILSSHLHHF